MKSLLSFFFGLALSTQFALADSRGVTGLKEIFDDYHFALTVQWDQQDQNFLADARSKLASQLEELRRQGVSNNEISRYARTMIKDQNLVKEMDMISLQVRLNQLSNGEANKMIMAAVERSYQTGANWNGEAWIAPLAVLNFIALIVLLVVVSEKCPSEGECHTCDLAYEEC